MIPIETERLIISHGTIEDNVKVHEYDFNYLQGIEGICEKIKRNPNEVRSWFQNDSSMEEHYKRLEAKRSYNFIIYLKETKEPIGDIGFDRYNEEIKGLEISCWLHPNYWGNGYAKEALIKAMEYIFSLGYDNIIYGYYEGNERSKRNCEKIGFIPFKQVPKNNCFGNPSIEYQNIMSKERFKELYKKHTK